MIRNILAVVYGFGSGMLVAGAVFAFISVIGVVPRLAQKTNTSSKIIIYEESLMLGGILGSILTFFNLELSFAMYKPLVAVVSFASGIFFGCLAMSLAEMLDVIPILTRRGKVEKGMFYFILFIAVGKLVGSLAYFIIPGFYKVN